MSIEKITLQIENANINIFHFFLENRQTTKSRTKKIEKLKNIQNSYLSASSVV